MSELKDFQQLVIANASHVRGLRTGERAPDFTLHNALIREVSLGQTLRAGPVILKFYRGEWCPICNKDLRDIQQHLSEIRALGASVLAVSPQQPDDALSAKEKNSLEFEVLSDPDQKVIRAYQLQFDPGEDYHSRRDLTKLNADGSKFLPVPATFIINRDFTIAASHVDPNYTERMPPEEMLRVLAEL